ncbi:MAG: GTP-binding protein, partial [Cyanobacteriota bacterium]
MPSRRLWIWIALALVALILAGVVLQARTQLLWQLSYWLPGGLVGPLLLLVVGVVLLAALQLGWPWLQALRRGRTAGSSAGNKTDLQLPFSRREAAARNLEAIDRTLERV